VLIAFEGIDGAGKTTQAVAACEKLRETGYDAIYLREPTDGPHGTRLRQLMVSGRESIKPMEEFGLFLADREDDVKRNIRPALDRGSVICIDRYYISSIAYQGALGIDPVFIRTENEKIAPVPDLILYFRIPVKDCVGRIVASRKGGQNLFERSSYQARVFEQFEAMDFPQMARLDAMQPVEALHKEVMRAITTAVARRLRLDS
jgi:dTMP kinase